MALNRAILKNNILEILHQMSEEEDAELRPEDQMDIFAEKLSVAIHSYVKSAQVSSTIPTGGVIVAGSPTTQTNPAPIIVTGVLL